MRRILTVLAVTALLVIALAVPALADNPDHPGECSFEQGKTYCTEKDVIDSGSELLGMDRYLVNCAPEGAPYLGLVMVTETTFRTYTDYRITETTYAGVSTQVLEQTTRTEREYGPEQTSTQGGCGG
jgi:hypothetical protein